MYIIYDLHASPYPIRKLFSYDKHYLVVDPTNYRRYGYDNNIYSALCSAENNLKTLMADMYVNLLETLIVNSTVDSLDAYKDQYPEFCI